MKHILIVDDDIHINKMLDEVLVHERYMVSMLTWYRSINFYKTRTRLCYRDFWGRIITTN